MQSKQASNIGRKDYLASGAADWWTLHLEILWELIGEHFIWKFCGSRLVNTSSGYSVGADWWTLNLEILGEPIGEHFIWIFWGSRLVNTSSGNSVGADWWTLHLEILWELIGEHLILKFCESRLVNTSSGNGLVFAWRLWFCKKCIYRCSVRDTSVYILYSKTCHKRTLQNCSNMTDRVSSHHKVLTRDQKVLGSPPVWVASVWTYMYASGVWVHLLCGLFLCGHTCIPVVSGFTSCAGCFCVDMHVYQWCLGSPPVGCFCVDIHVYQLGVWRVERVLVDE